MPIGHEIAHHFALIAGISSCTSGAGDLQRRPLGLKVRSPVQLGARGAQALRQDRCCSPADSNEIVSS